MMTLLNPFRKTVFLLSVLVTSMTVLSCEEDIPEECGDISFAVETDDGTNNYTFKLENVTVSDIQWFIDEQINEDETGESFTVELTPGTYSVCVSAFSEACGEILNFCTEIVVEAEGQQDDCPTIEFEYDKTAEGSYVFELDNQDATSVVWKVNDDIVGQEARLEKDLPAGTHEVCVTATFESCDTEVTSCQTIVIEGNGVDCPEEVTFEYAGNDENHYVFELVNEGAASVEWLINEDVIATEEGFEKHFDPGTYEVCVIATFDGCESALTSCQTIVVEEECPEIRFGTNYDESTGMYEFVLGLDDQPTSIKWTVNGDIVGDDDFLEKDFEPGTYEVCVTATFENCLDAITYCETITVEDDEEGCPEMYFVYQAADNGEYHFIADFLGIENLEWYGWFINDDLVEDEGTINNGDNNFIHTFDEPGTYTVCIMTETPECPAGTSFCKEIIIE